MGGGADSQYRWCRKGLGLRITTEGLKEAAKAYGKSVYGQHLKKVAAGEIVNSPREY